jgi:hypothetical protein
VIEDIFSIELLDSGVQMRSGVLMLFGTRKLMLYMSREHCSVCYSLKNRSIGIAPIPL